MKRLLFVAILLSVCAFIFVAHAEEYGIGDTWTVDGQWTMTINSIEETQDRNPYSEKKPAAVYIVTYTYSNIGYIDSMGIMDGLYLSIDDKIVDSDGMMGYSYPASYEYYPQQVPVGAKCKAQTAIGVDNAGLPIKLYVDDFDGNGKKRSAVFVLGGETTASATGSEQNKEADKDSGKNKILNVSDIIPDENMWGLSSDAFQRAYPASYTSTKVGKSPALVQSGLTIEGYDMKGYFVFSGGKLSKIAYILVDDSDKTAVKACAAELAKAMENALGVAAAKGKSVSEWNNGTIQIGTAKLKNYTGKDNSNACIIFKEGKASPSLSTEKPTSIPKKASIISLDEFEKVFNATASQVSAAKFVNKTHLVSDYNIYKKSPGAANTVIQYMYNDSEILQLAMPVGTEDIVQIMCTYWPYGPTDYSADFFWLFGEACVAANVIDNVIDVRDLFNELDFINHMNDGDGNELTKKGLTVGYWVVDGVGYCFYIETI